MAPNVNSMEICPIKITKNETTEKQFLLVAKGFSLPRKYYTQNVRFMSDRNKGIFREKQVY